MVANEGARRPLVLAPGEASFLSSLENKLVKGASNSNRVSRFRCRSKDRPSFAYQSPEAVLGGSLECSWEKRGHSLAELKITWNLELPGYHTVPCFTFLLGWFNHLIERVNGSQSIMDFATVPIKQWNRARWYLCTQVACVTREVF